MSTATEVPSLVVIGGGVAGLSTALWGAVLGLRVVLFEARGRHGGQLFDIPHPIENIPGQPSVAGAVFAATLRAQVLAAGVDLRADQSATLDARSLTVRAGGVTLSPAAVVLATGVRRRLLGVRGEMELVGRGVIRNIGVDERRFAGLRAVVIGGGDDAFEHASLLAPHASEVTLVHRSDRFTARPALRDLVLGDARIALRPNTTVDAIEGSDHVEGIALRTREGSVTLAADVVFVCVGPSPVSEGFGVTTDDRGYIRVDRLQRTSRSGVFAVGDVCCPEAPTLATAMGHGATAAKAMVAGFTRPVEPARPADRLSLRGLTLPARIGAYPRERRRLQTLTFDISFEVDASASSPSDSLLRTIDYASVARDVAALLGEQHFNLIETVADVLAARLLERFGARAVRVQVTKPGVPQRLSAASIEVERRRV